MIVREAKKLHKGDEVQVKKTETVMQVLKVAVHLNHVCILLEDGNWYEHKEVR